jgi:hypothetical protein
VSDPARPPVTPIRPTEVPTLDDLAGDPGRAASLPAEIRRAVTLRCVALIGACAVPEEAPTPPACEPDRVLLIEEAAGRLGMTKDFLYRNWATLHLGYKDVDGRVKFPLSKVERYLRTRAGTHA